VFAELINQAKSTVTGLLLKYVARASVAVPFIIAIAFALAAITAMLVDRFGHVVAYWIVAAGLALIGIVAAIIVSAKEHEEEVAEQAADKADTENVVSDVTAQAMVQTPIALLGALLTTSGGATSALSAARGLGRHFPLVILLGLIAVLFWPSEPTSSDEDIDVGRRPNGADEDMPSAMRH
jgi:MFS family permease